MRNNPNRPCLQSMSRQSSTSKLSRLKIADAKPFPSQMLSPSRKISTSKLKLNNVASTGSLARTMPFNTVNPRVATACTVFSQVTQNSSSSSQLLQSEYLSVSRHQSTESLNTAAIDAKRLLNELSEFYQQILKILRSSSFIRRQKYEGIHFPCLNMIDLPSLMELVRKILEDYEMVRETHKQEQLEFKLTYQLEMESYQQKIQNLEIKLHESREEAQRLTEIVKMKWKSQSLDEKMQEISHASLESILKKIGKIYFGVGTRGEERTVGEIVEEIFRHDPMKFCCSSQPSQVSEIATTSRLVCI